MFLENNIELPDVLKVMLIEQILLIDEVIYNFVKPTWFIFIFSACTPAFWDKIAC